MGLFSIQDRLVLWIGLPNELTYSPWQSKQLTTDPSVELTCHQHEQTIYLHLPAHGSVTPLIKKPQITGRPAILKKLLCILVLKHHVGYLQDLKMYITYYCDVSPASKVTVSLLCTYDVRSHQQHLCSPSLPQPGISGCGIHTIPTNHLLQEESSSKQTWCKIGGM